MLKQNNINPKNQQQESIAPEAVEFSFNGQTLATCLAERADGSDEIEFLWRLMSYISVLHSAAPTACRQFFEDFQNTLCDQSYFAHIFRRFLIDFINQYPESIDIHEPGKMVIADMCFTVGNQMIAHGLEIKKSFTDEEIRVYEAKLEEKIAGQEVKDNA